MSRLFASTSSSRSHRSTPVHRGLGDRLVRGLVVLVAMLVATLGLPTAIAQTSASAADARVTPSTNPDLAAGCGLDVVLVLDGSGSIGDVSGAVQNVKDASRTFLNAFQDTNTRVGIVTFSSSANLVVPLTTVTAATNTGSGAHNTAINGYGSNGYTNWEAALSTASNAFSSATARSVPKLVVFMTDGAPNTTIASSNGAFNDADPGAVDPAVTKMNAMKAAGIHSLVVGVGAAFSNTSPSNANIDALYRVSQYPTPKIYPDTAFDAATTDLILQKNFSALETDLRNVANQICDGTLIVTKYSSTANAPDTYTKAGSGWDFTTSVNPAGGWILPSTGSGASKTASTDATSTALFQWNPGTTNWTKTATVTDVSKTNYTPDKVTCTVNGTAIANPTLGGTDNKDFGVTVGSGKKVECNVYNKFTGKLNTDVAITKTVSDSTVVTGTAVTWTLKATNNGPNTATNVVFTDVLPAGLGAVTNVSAAAGTTFASGVWTIPSLSVGAGSAKTLTFKTTVDTVGAKKNVVSLTSLSQNDTDSSNDSANATVTGTNADVTVTKTPDVTTQVVNGNVVWTIKATNNGTAAAANVKVTDTLPAGLTYVSSSTATGSYSSATNVWSVGTLAASGGSATLTLTTKGTTAGPKTNKVDVTTDTPESNTNNNHAEGTATFTIADLGVTKTADKHDVILGDTVVWTVKVTNTGTADAANVVVTDAIPAGLTVVSTNPVGALSGNTWNAGTIAAGASKTLTITTTVNSLSPVTNQACATTTTPETSTTNNCGSDTVSATASDVTVTKVPDLTTVYINGTVVWTIKVSNTGKANAQNVVVTDTAPAGLTLGAGTASQGTYNAATKVWNVGTVNGTVSTPPTGASATLTLASSVGNTLGALTNKVDVTTTTPETNTNNNHGEGTTTVTAADIAVTKTADKHAVLLGDTVVWTVKVTNNGPATANGVSVTDTIPAGLQVLSTNPVGALVGNTWTVGTLTSGASATLTITTKATATGTITNSATGTTTTPETNTGNNEGHDSVVVTVAKVSVTKTADEHNPSLDGTVVWSVKVQNDGSADAANVVVTDVLPSGLTLTNANPSTGSYSAGTWTVGTLAKNGGSATLTLTTKVTKTGSIKNTACASTSTADLTTTDDCDDDTVTVHAPAVSITKVASADDVNYQGNVTWTVKATNSGDASALNVNVADVLPAGLTYASSTATVGSYDSTTGAWAVGTLAANSSATLTITTTATKVGSLTNQACVTTSSAQSQTPTAPVCADDTVKVHAPVVSVTKTADTHTPGYNGPVVWTVTVTNTGDAAAANVVVNDAAVAGLTIDSYTTTPGTTFDKTSGTWTVGTLAKDGGSATLTLNSTVTKLGAVKNTACATTTTAQVVPGPACDDDTVTVTAPVVNVTKVANADTAVKDGNVSWTITAKNTGDRDALGVVVTDTNPGGGLTVVSGTPSAGTFDKDSGVWTVGTLAKGATATLVVTTKVTKTGTVTNKACVTTTSAQVDSTLKCDDDTVTGTAADVTIVKTVDPASTVLGTNVTWTIKVTNNGDADAANVVVDDVLPAGTSLVSTTPAGALVNDKWTVGTLAKNGGTATLTVTTTMTATGAVKNSAHVSTTTPETNYENNDSNATTTVTAPNLAITKTADVHQTYLGGNVVWTVTVKNNGDADAANVLVEDVLPAGAQLVSTTPAGALVNNAWSIGTLAKGATATLTITTKTVATGDVTNEACVTTSTQQVGDNEETARCDEDTTTVTRDAKLAIDKKQSTTTPNPRQPGSDVTYDITVSSTGKSPANGVRFTDVLPAGLTFKSANGGTDWTCTNAAQTVTCLYIKGDLAAGTSATPVAITATVGSSLLRSAPVTNTACITPSQAQNPAALVRKAIAVDDTAQCSSAQTTFPTGTLSVVKSNTPATDTTAKPGDTITYTLKVTADGELDQTDVSVYDDVPGYATNSASSMTTYVDGSATCVAPPVVTAANCAVTPVTAGGKVTGLGWKLGALAHGQSRTVTFKVTINDPNANGDTSISEGTVANIGFAKSTETTPVESNKVTNPFEVTAVLGTKIPADTASDPASAPAGVLAHTGSDLFREIGLALSLLVAGAFILRGTRRREQGEL